MNIRADDAIASARSRSPLATRQVAAAFTLYSKLNVDPRHRRTGGLPLGFVEKPSDFDAEFEWACTPDSEERASAGLGAIDGLELERDGAWSIRKGQNNIYLCNLCHVRPSDRAEFLHGCTPTEQAVFAEQITWRFDRDDWAWHAPSLFDQCLQAARERGAAWKSGGAFPALPEAFTVEAPAQYPDDDPLPEFEDLTFDTNAPTIVLTTASLSQNNQHPMVDLLGRMTVTQRRNATGGYGWRMRLRAASFQLFDQTLLPEGDSDPDGVRLSARQRYNLHLRYRNGIAGASLDMLATWVTEASPHYADVWERCGHNVNVHRYGQRKDIREFSASDVRNILVILDRCYDLALTRQSEKKRIRSIYCGWIASALLSDKGDQAFFDTLSRLEFGPSLLLWQICSVQTNLQAWTSARVARLKQLDPQLFERLLARMMIQDRAEPVLPEYLFDSRFSTALCAQGVAKFH